MIKDNFMKTKEIDKEKLENNNKIINFKLTNYKYKLMIGNKNYKKLIVTKNNETKAFMDLSYKVDDLMSFLRENAEKKFDTKEAIKLVNITLKGLISLSDILSQINRKLNRDYEEPISIYQIREKLKGK